MLYKIIGDEDIVEGTGLDELYQLPYNTPSDRRGVVVTYAFDAPVGVKSEYSVVVKSEHTTADSVKATSTTTTSSSAATLAKRARPTTSSAIPSHAEVISLDDSDTESDNNNNSASTGDSGNSTTKRIKSEHGGGAGAEPVLTNMERREMFLRALEKRGNV